MTKLILVGTVLCLAIVALVARGVLSRRAREQRRAAARARREEQNRIWHERMAKRPLERAD